VGNVEGVIVRADASHAESVVMRGGTVGFKLPPLRAGAVPISPGDTLAMATDGIRPGFRGEVVPTRSPREIADAVLAAWSTSTDDACVLVARYTGTEVAV
jgi:hypothetical protein